MKAIYCVLSIVSLMLLSGAGAFATPVILNFSHSANPGDVVYLEGDNFGAAPVVYMTPRTLSTVQLPVLTSGWNEVTVQIPSSDWYNQYSLKVEDTTTGTYSNVVTSNLINGMSFDTPEVAEGSVLRVFGRNLGGSGLILNDISESEPDVWCPATGSLNDGYTLHVSVPTSGLVPGDSYSVRVNSGGDYRACQENLVAVAPAADNYSLGVGWAGDFAGLAANTYNVKTQFGATGNGTTDDSGAINNAIAYANSHGGGVVSFPAGTYYIYHTITMLSNVVLSGAGQSSTTIETGSPNPISGQNHNGAGYMIYWNACSHCGIYNLTIANDSSGTNQQINSMTTAQTLTNEVFLSNVTINMGLTDQSYWKNIDRFAMINCTVTQGPEDENGYNGPLDFGGLTNFVIRGNHITFYVGDGVQINSGSLPGSNYSSNWLSHDGVFENNTLTRNAGTQVQNSRQFEANFVTNLQVLNNTFNVTNGSLTNQNNDGETILSEGGAADPFDMCCGNCSAYTLGSNGGNDTITVVNLNNDNSELFSGAAKGQLLGPAPCIAIVGGTGAGQWRPILTSSPGSTNCSSGKVTLQTEPAGNDYWGIQQQEYWQENPDGSSQIVVFNWSLANCLIEGNNMTADPRGIWLGNGPYRDVAIVKNTLTNNDGILIQPVQDTSFNPTGSYPNGFFGFDWRVQTVSNTVTDNSGWQPAYIGVNPVQIYDMGGTNGDQYNDSMTWAALCVGFECRSNSVTGYLEPSNNSTPNVVEAAGNTENTEGYYNQLKFQETDPVLGYQSWQEINGNWAYITPSCNTSIFQNDTATNIFYPFQLGVSSTCSVLWNTGYSNSGTGCTWDGMTGTVEYAQGWWPSPYRDAETLIHAGP